MSRPSPVKSIVTIQRLPPMPWVSRRAPAELTSWPVRPGLFWKTCQRVSVADSRVWNRWVSSDARKRPFGTSTTSALSGMRLFGNASRSETRSDSGPARSSFVSRSNA